MYFKFFWYCRGIAYSILFKRIGFLTYIGKPLFVYGWRKITIGRNVRIFPGLRIEVHGANSSIQICDGVSIAQHVQITSAGNLTIGKNTIILANVFVTNIDHRYDDVNLHMRKQEITVKETIVGENCLIGFGAAIQAGTILGSHCVVGAGAVVRGVYPDYTVIVGVPGVPIKTYNKQTKTWNVLS